MNRTALRSTLIAFATAFLLANVATAFEEVRGPLDSDPKLPTIPEPGDIQLSPDEWAQVQKGEIVVQIIERSSEDRQARAIGYLKHNPSQLFDVATDSTLAPRLVPEVRKVEVLERSSGYKRFHGEADFSMVLPMFQYTMLSAYNDTRTGQAWTQVKGDLDKNEGSHAFFWDPQRKETLAVFTYDMALKGILSIVPEWVVIRIASRTLPDFLHNLDSIIDTVYAEDVPRAERVALEWKGLSGRLEGGQLASRVWQGPIAVASRASKAPAAATPDE